MNNKLKLLTGVIIVDGEAEEAILDGSLDDFYRVLDCHTIDIVEREINGEFYSIYIDDAGLFKDDRVINAVSKDGKEMLFGNLFICRHDKEGKPVSLTKEQIKEIIDGMEENIWGSKMAVSYKGTTITIPKNLLRYTF